MINNWGAVRAGALLACATAALLALAGCSSGSSSSSAPGGATASPSGSAPAWASALGSGVTVVAPETVAPGNGSPGAVMTGFIDAVDTKNYLAVCGYLPPSDESQCRTAFNSVSPSAVASEMPFAKKPSIGYVAIDGTEALVGTTGEYCAPDQSPECFTNNDPAAIFSSGKSFSALWKAALASNNSTAANVYSLASCHEIGGKWYADLSV